MRCTTVREALSSQLDGEASVVSHEHVSAHLLECAECREWQELAHTVARRTRVGRPVPPPELTAKVLDRVRSRRSRLARGRRPALVVTAVLQLAITVPLLVLGHDHDAGRHAAHELGSFDLTLAVVFVIGAWRPHLSEGLAWAAGVAALGLLSTAVIDWVAGQTPGVDELQHLIAAVGAVLLIWQARDGRHRPAVSQMTELPSQRDSSKENVA